ncbi:hypothetical protein BOTBODRAFT_548563 [Botryobasidium botryosum FD-172 SS1]|uniref:Secreted protein n=1 Tax=Botryobasidium botryosum (strain FD-172 SS1) TaxID=930990 RepID=A0A067N2R5_BOTB1|nr:hypothetical protein BOTBODRAFT_548563 [Botryobasidium botryosum FD-172 SS1]
MKEKCTARWWLVVVSRVGSQVCLGSCCRCVTKLARSTFNVQLSQLQPRGTSGFFVRSKSDALIFFLCSTVAKAWKFCKKGCAKRPRKMFGGDVWWQGNCPSARSAPLTIVPPPPRAATRKRDDLCL